MSDVAKPVLVLTREFPRDVEVACRAKFDVVANPGDAVLDGGHIAERCIARRAGAILCTPTEQMSARVIHALPDTVEMIATYSVGYDHIAVEAAAERGIRVSNTPDVLTEATADVAMLCLLGAARKAHESQSMLRNGNWTRWKPDGLLGLELSGASLGIVGFGRIGRAVARRALGFGMRVHFWNRSPVSPESLRDDGLSDCKPVSSLDGLFESVDVVSLHVPAGRETHKLVDARRLSLMKPGVILVNTARGTLLDDAAVVDALRSGLLGGVGLDVFDGEPEIHGGYLDAPNTYLLPHIGSATVATRNAMGLRALHNLEAHFSGREIPDRVC